MFFSIKLCFILSTLKKEFDPTNSHKYCIISLLWMNIDFYFRKKKSHGQSFSFQIVQLIKLLLFSIKKCIVTKTLIKGQHAARKPAILLEPDRLSWSLNFYLWLSFELRDKFKAQVAKQSWTLLFHFYKIKAITFCKCIHFTGPL